MNRILQFLLCIIALIVVGCSQLSEPAGVLDGNKCTICHAFPPTDKIHTIHYVNNHFDCNVCHPGASLNPPHNNTATHNNGTVDIAFTLPFDSLKSGSYDPVTQTCSNLYCHGSLTSGQTSSVRVSDTAGPTKGCALCHDMTKTLSQNHHALLPDSIPAAYMVLQTRVSTNCSQCHNGYSLTDTTVNDSLHVNGRVDTTGCNQCHAAKPWSSTTPPGTVKLRCGACHDIATLQTRDHHKLIPIDSIPGTTIKTNRLFPNCSQCHHSGYNMTDSTINDSTHINGKIDTAGCNQCHKAISWNSALPRGTVKLYCDQCHDFASLMKHKHHNIPDTTTIKSLGCTPCHPDSRVSDSTVSTTLHINGKIDTQNCNVCHAARVWVKP